MEHTLLAAQFPRSRSLFVAALTVAYLSLLAWQHFNGGVPGHSFLARDDMPVISNWWGVLAVPLITTLLTGRIQARLKLIGTDHSASDAALRAMSLAFGGALLYGAVMALMFASDRSEVTSLLFQALPVVGFILPVYRAEYVLGFVLGLTYTFGPVLPLVIATGVALVSALLHAVLRPLFARLLTRVHRTDSRTQGRRAFFR